MKDMELPKDRYTITIDNRETSKEPMEIHIDYFDQNELINALHAGVEMLGLNHRILITASRSFFGHESSEWETT